MDGAWMEDSFEKSWRDTEEWHCWYAWFLYLQWSKTRQGGERQMPVESEWKQFCKCLTNWVGPEWINCSYRIPVISLTFLTEIFINIHGLFMLGGAPGSHAQIFQTKTMRRYKFSFLSLDWRVMLDKSESWTPADLEIEMLVDLLPYLIKFSTIERRVTTKHIPALAQGKDVVLKNNQPGNFVDRNGLFCWPNVSGD